MTNAPDDLMNRSRNIAKELDELKFQLNGVSAKASWEEIPPARIPLSKKISEMAYTRYGMHSAVTQTERESFETIKALFPPWLEALKKIAEEKIPGIEKELDQLGAPWTPDRMPVWKK